MTNGDNTQDCLYLFIDEAGTFDFSHNGTKHFTLSAMSAKRPFLWESPLIALKYDLMERGLVPEIKYFHASEDRQVVRNEVFNIISDNLTDFHIDSVIIEKRKTGPALQAVEKFYPRMLSYLLRYVLQPQFLQGCANIIVITDRIPINSKRKAVEKSVKQTLTAMLPSHVNYKVLHHESMSCIGLQVVDYCNWAIFRKWRDNDLRSYSLISGAIRTEFDIFRNGTTYYY
ncbi:MAG: DUF3800 domain-containing protein [Actinomycetota bacterium]|nr:DUF3800 domain-containing protein [Actinomycetota bacterium]